MFNQREHKEQCALCDSVMGGYFTAVAVMCVQVELVHSREKGDCDHEVRGSKRM